MFKIFSLKIFPILLVNFLGIFGYSLVIPILIFVVIDFGGNGFIYGLLGATYPLFQFVGAPRLGKLSDRIGRKKVLIITQLGSFLAWMLFFVAFLLPNTTLWSHSSEVVGAFTMSLPLLCLFVARMVDGYTGGNISVANAYLSDISSDEDRSKNFGLMGTSSSMGFVIGPVISGVLAATLLGEMLPILVAAVVALVAAVIIHWRLEESVACVVQTPLRSFKDVRKFFQVEHRECFVEGEVEAGGKGALNMRQILSIEGMPRMYATYFLTFLAFSIFYVALPIYASEVLDWSALELGLFLAYFSLLMIVVQGPMLAALSKRFAEIPLIVSGIFFLIIGFTSLTFGTTLFLYLGVSFMALGNGLMWPSFLAVLSQMGEGSAQGSVQGYGASMGSLASMAGLILGGFLFEFYGAWVFALAAILFLIMALVWSWGPLKPLTVSVGQESMR